MLKERIENITKSSEEIINIIGDIISNITSLEDENGNKFDLENIFLNQDISIKQNFNRLIAISEIIIEFNKRENNIIINIMPVQTITTIETSINNLKSDLENFIQYTKYVTSGKIKTIDVVNFQIHGVPNWNSQNSILNIINSTESLLHTILSNSYISRSHVLTDSKTVENKNISTLYETNRTLGEARKELAQISDMQNKLNEKIKQIIENIDEVKRLKDLSTSDHKTITEYLATATQQKVSIEQIYNKADSLNIDIELYQTKFNKFQEALDFREKSIEDGNNEIKNLTNEFERKKKEIDGIIEKSEQMLSSATVSGLASNFNKIKNDLTKEMRLARLSFYFGIFLMLTSTIPLIIFLFPNILIFLSHLIGIPFADQLFSQNISNNTQDGWQYIGQVISRIIILLPAAWFVSFSAIRHSSLFRLREHYAYKYSMAVSVEGFKLQAPQYKQDIAAMVLEELAFNPADKLIPSKDIKEGKAPSKLIGLILEKMRSRSNETN